MNPPDAHHGGVLFIAPSAYPLGGVAVWLNYLVQGLRARGVRAAAGLVAGRWHDTKAYRGHYPGLTSIDIPNPTGSAEGRIRAIEKAVEAYRPDTVVAVNIAAVYPAIRRLRARGSPVRVAMALHAIAADLLGDLRRESDVIDAVIATNRLAETLCVESAGMPSGRVMYAACGVAAEAAPSTRMSRERGAELRVVWVGRIEQRQKRSGDLLALMTQLDEANVSIRLTLAGDGPDRETLLQSLAPWIDQQRVRYLGALPADSVAAQVYEQADVLLVTSEWETGPIVIWEAMNAGVAVVTSRYVGSGLEGALQHERNCLMFPIGDMKSAAHCLAALDANPALHDELIRAGHALVQQRYTIDKSVEAWSRCLNAISQLPPISPARMKPLAHTGRLDRLLGAHRAETIRSLLGKHFDHRDAGGEWPHTAESADDDALLAQGAALDQRHNPMQHDLHT